MWTSGRQKPADFNPRPPRGGRPIGERIVRIPLAISIHALREEGDWLRVFSFCMTLYFNPRPPRGGRREATARRCANLDISIHALREEGDIQFDI